MPTPFDAFGYVEAQQTVRHAEAASSVTGFQFAPLTGTGFADSTPRPIVASIGGGMTALIRQMLEGDMWLGGQGWIGPRPGPLEDGYSETMAMLHQGFVSENALADIIDRHVAGVIGKEPQWGLTPRRNIPKDEKPTDAEQRDIGEAEALITEWWDARKLHKFMIAATRTLLYARRSVVRLYVPSGKLSSENIIDENAAPGRTKTVKVIRAVDVPAGLSFVWPDAPLPELSTVAQDPDTKESVGIVLYRTGQTVQGIGSGTEVAEMTYLAEPNAGGSAMTMIKRTSPANGSPAFVRLDFGGRLSMYEMTRSPFITAQMLQIQRALNLALSALPRNLITSGWLERVIANAQMPGKWVELNGRKVWQPDKHITGAGQTTYLRGLKQTDEGTGSTTYATPDVRWRDPAPIAPTVEAQEALYRVMLREAKQEHVLMSQDIKASGKSREQARADFEMTLRPTAAEVNALGRWIIETALAMAEAFSNSVGKYTSQFRATFECEVDTGPITSDERIAIDGSVAAGTLSVETAMGLEGIADPAAEVARISAQPGANLDVVVRQAQAFASFVNAGSDVEGAALAVGLDPDIARKLVPQFVDPGADPNAPPVTGKSAPAPHPNPTDAPRAKPGSSGPSGNLPSGAAAG